MRKIKKSHAKIMALLAAGLCAASSANAIFKLGFLPGYEIEFAFLVNIAGVILGRFLAPVLAHNYIDVHQHEID